MWISDPINSSALKCQTQQQRLLKKYKEKTKDDMEAYAKLSEDFEESKSLILLKQERLAATYQLSRPEMEVEPEGIREQLESYNRVDNYDTRRKLEKEIANLEERLIQLTKSINIIQRRIYRIQEEFYNLIVLIENKCDMLMSIYDASARKVYNKEKLPADPSMPTEPPTVKKLRQAGLLNHNKAEWTEGMLTAPLRTKQAGLSALPTNSPNYAQLLAAYDIDEELDIE